MALAHRWTNRNLSRLELAFAVLTIAIFIGAFMDRGLRIFAMAEERAMQASVLNINTALQIMLFQTTSAGRNAELMQWDHANPMKLLDSSGMIVNVETLPAHPELARLAPLSIGLGFRYLGEFEFPDPQTIDGGYWYYDLGEKVLVYRIKNSEFFQSPLSGLARIRFAVELRFDDLNGDGQYNPDAEAVYGAALLPQDEYHWMEAGS